MNKTKYKTYCDQCGRPILRRKPFNVKTINQYDTELQAIQARDIYARMCNSHDTFVILDTREAL